jgi:lipopolysaccharide export system permease protein
MKLLRRYIASTVLQAIALVLVVIVALDVLALVIEQVGEIRGGYSFGRVLEYVAFRTPGFIVANTGFAALIGCLAGLGILANQNELTVLRTSGISILQIVGMVMRPALLVIVFSMGVGEVSPYADRTAVGIRDVAQAAVPAPVRSLANTLTNRIQEKIRRNAARLYPAFDPDREKNIWNRDGNEFVRFAIVLPHGEAYGITRFHFNDDRILIWIQYAQQGNYQSGGWQLTQVRTTYFDKVLREEKQDSLYWKTSLSPELLTFVSTEPENLTFSELGSYGDFLHAQQRDNRAYELQWWKRVCKPLEIFSLVLIAIFFVFGSLRQVTIGQRIFVGVMVGVVFQTLQNMASVSSLVYGFSPLVAVLLPIAVCTSVGLVMLSRLR